MPQSTQRPTRRWSAVSAIIVGLVAAAGFATVPIALAGAPTAPAISPTVTPPACQLTVKQ